MNNFNRIKLFLSIVWRPCVTPHTGENWTLTEHWQSLMSARLAWRVAGILGGK